jgi:hypothetical protein
LDGRGLSCLIGDEHAAGGFPALMTNLLVALSAPTAATDYFHALDHARDLDALSAGLVDEHDASMPRRRVLEALKQYRCAAKGASVEDLRRWSPLARRHGWNLPF